MDSRISTRQQLVQMMELLRNLRDQLADVEDSLRDAINGIRVCHHPVEYREELGKFGDFATWQCRICNEVRSGR